MEDTMKILVALVVGMLSILSLTSALNGQEESPTIFPVVPDLGPVITVTVPGIEKVPCVEGGACTEGFEVREVSRMFTAPISRGMLISGGNMVFPMYNDDGNVVGAVVLSAPSTGSPQPSSKEGA